MGSAGERTYRDHPDDLANARFLQDREAEIPQAAGALRVTKMPVNSQTSSMHLLGTCRMGNDSATSEVTRYRRSHEVPNTDDGPLGEAKAKRRTVTPVLLGRSLSRLTEQACGQCRAERLLELRAERRPAERGRELLRLERPPVERLRG